VSAQQTRRPSLVLAASILASGLAMIDGSVVNVGLPAIGADLHGRGEDLQWIINGYMLPLSAILLLGGALGDRYGRRRLLVLGIVVFALASVACALAPSMPWLFAARAAQGIGSALLLPNSLAVLGEAYPGEKRGQAIGVWAAVGAMAAAFGPVVGGGLIDLIGWRTIFLINLPFAACAVWLAMKAIRPASDEGERTTLDLPGAALVTLALGAITWALTDASARNAMTPASWGATAASLTLFAAFVWTEHRRGARAMVPLSMFASKTFVGLSLLTLLIYGVLGGFMALLPYTLIKTSGYSATAAGAALIPFPIVLAVASPMIGTLAGRIGSRLPLIVGGLVLAAGLALTLRIGAPADYWREILPAVVVQALGMAGIAAPLTNAVLGSVDERHTASASGFNSAVSRTGGLIATALLGGVFAARTQVIDRAHLALAVMVGVTLAGAACGLLVERRKPSR
jgi:EmrB/QacA subfamily drug resistance transporter